jgi:Co/Zn/Cd efflux system component
MLKILAIFILFAIWLPVHGHQEGGKPGGNQQHGDSASSPPPPPAANIQCVVQQDGTTIKCDYSPANPPNYLSRLIAPENVPNIALVFVGLLGVCAAMFTLLRIHSQAKEMRLQRIVMHNTLGAIKTQASNMDKQTDILRDSVAASKDSARAANDQIQMMKDRERSRLSIEPLPLTALDTDVQWQRIEFLVTNFGGSLALKIRVISDCLLTGNNGFPDRDDFIPIPPSIRSNADTILPEHLEGGHMDSCWNEVIKPSKPIKVVVPLFWYPEVNDVESIHSVYIHVWGRVDYNDIFGEHHFFRYRFCFHLLQLKKPYEGLDGIVRFPIQSVAKWSGNQYDEESEAN